LKISAAAKPAGGWRRGWRGVASMRRRRKRNQAVAWRLAASAWLA